MTALGGGDGQFFNEMGRRRVQARPQGGGLGAVRSPVGGAQMGGGMTPPRPTTGTIGAAMPRPRTPEQGAGISMSRPPAAPPARVPMGAPPMGGGGAMGGGGGFMGDLYKKHMDIAGDPNMSFSNNADVYHWMEFGGRPGYDPSHMYLPGTPRL